MCCTSLIRFMSDEGIIIFFDTTPHVLMSLQICIECYGEVKIVIEFYNKVKSTIIEYY